MQVKVIAEVDRLKPVPAHQYQILRVMGPITDYKPDLMRADLIIDALIGYGLSGPPHGSVAEWIDRAAGRAAAHPILAPDAPPWWAKARLPRWRLVNT